MARFRSQVSKGIEEQPETRNQKPETLEEESQDISAMSEALVMYSESDLEPVNVAGFKVPYVVREHWKKGCREKRVKLSPMLKKFLVGEFGLPPGIGLEDL